MADAIKAARKGAMTGHSTSHASKRKRAQLRTRSPWASCSTLNSPQLQQRVRKFLRNKLSCFQDSVAGLVIPPLNFDEALPGQIYRKQAPLRSPAPPDIRRVGMSVNGQGDAMERLRRTSYSHLPPRLLPSCSLAYKPAALNRWLLNTLTSGVNP